MNPFDLPGPQFLALYALLGVTVIAILYIVKQKAEAGDSGRAPVSDPYAIAYLRGGSSEAVQLGVAVLVDRQLLEVGDGENVARREGVTPNHGANELERAILEQATIGEQPREIVASQRLQEIARRSHEPGLIRLGLIAGPDVRARRWRDVAAAVAALVFVAAIKIAIGLARNRPVSFLVVSAIVFSALTLVVIRGARTVKGDRILDDLRTLFDALRGRAAELRPNASTSELALLMAVFGYNAVPADIFPVVGAFRPVPSAADDGSTSSFGSPSSCGSSSSGGSCGGGGGDGGGGGGCGGCGSS